MSTELKMWERSASSRDGDDLNVVLFSTSGVHGTYVTIDSVEAREEDSSRDVTFLVIQPRIVGLRYGNCQPTTPEDFAFLKKLRASSHAALSGIGASQPAPKEQSTEEPIHESVPFLKNAVRELNQIVLERGGLIATLRARVSALEAGSDEYKRLWLQACDAYDRKNPSGCVCSIDEKSDEVRSPCALHADWLADHIVEANKMVPAAMAENNMPPLPAPISYGSWTSCAECAKYPAPIFSEDQMHSYAQQYAALQVAEEREACAKLLERVEISALAADPVMLRYTVDLLTGCAAAIRGRSVVDEARGKT